MGVGDIGRALPLSYCLALSSYKGKGNPGTAMGNWSQQKETNILVFARVQQDETGSGPSRVWLRSGFYLGLVEVRNGAVCLGRWYTESMDVLCLGLRVAKSSASVEKVWRRSSDVLFNMGRELVSVLC